MRLLRAGVSWLVLVVAVTVVARGQNATQPPAETAKQAESLDSIIAEGWPRSSIKNLKPKPAGRPSEGKEEPLAVLVWLVQSRQYASAKVALAKVPMWNTLSSGNRETEIEGEELEKLERELRGALWRENKAGLTTEDYWAILSLIRERIEAYGRREQTLGNFARRLQYLLRSTDLWFLRPDVQDDVQKTTTEKQRKAVRAWVLKTLVACGEKALALKKHVLRPGPNTFTFEFWSAHYFSKEPGKGVALDELWKEWYGEPVPSELSRLRELVEKADEVKSSLKREARERAKEKEREESPAHSPEKFK